MPSYTMHRLRSWAAINIPQRRKMSRSQPIYRRKPAYAGTNAIRVGILALALLFLVIILLNVFFARVKPVIEALAVVEAREYVITVINSAVEKEITTGNLVYSEFVTLDKDKNGSVTALITDMAKVNVLQSRISKIVATDIVNVLHTDLRVPLGDALGTVLFSWGGPKIPVRMESVANVVTQFVNEFESSGINQTRHRIALNITTEIVILIPGGRTTAKVESTVPISETVIVGNVPNIYTN